MKPQITDTDLYRFLNNETSEQENRAILLWVSESEENRGQFRKIHQAYHFSQLKNLQAEIDVDKAWNSLNLKLPKPKSGKKTIQLAMVQKIAVAALVILTIGFGSLWTSEHFFSQKSSMMVRFEAPKGEKSKIMLADGTRVWLNSETMLEYDASNPRKVSLSGEAYFDVRKDKSHPFRVSTPSGMNVMVTGTKFDLQCYAGQEYVETTLEEGEVNITGPNSEKLAVLKPGQQAKYNPDNQRITLHRVSPEIYSVWKDNEMRFDHAGFTELIPRIERWYGVSIDLKGTRANTDRFTMTVKTESLRELLQMMQLTSKFTYEINGSQVAINLK